MEATKAEKARLGLFVALALAGLVAGLAALVGQRLLARTDPFYTRMKETVVGLELGSPVKLNGVDVGTVTGLAPDMEALGQSVIRFDVARGTPMKEDMRATLGTWGITGLKYLEITGGSVAAADIPPGGEVKGETSMLGRLSTRADSIAAKIDRLLGNVISITDADNRSQLDRLMESTANLSASLDSMVQDLGAVRPGKRIDGVLDGLEGIIGDLGRQVEKAQLDKTVAEFRSAAGDARKLTAEADLTLRQVREDLTQSMGSLRETMRNMSAFSRQIKDNPAVLLRGEDKQERRR